MSPIAKAKLLTIAELADRLRISKRSAYRVAREIGIAMVAPLLVPETDVDRFVASRMRGPRNDRSRHPLSEGLVEDVRNAADLLRRDCNVPGFVYFVEGAGLIKIGHSMNIEGRLAHLQAQSPISLHLVRLARGAALEPTLHHMFREHRAQGEWFDAAPVLAWLSAVGACLHCALRES